MKRLLSVIFLALVATAMPALAQNIVNAGGSGGNTTFQLNRLSVKGARAPNPIGDNASGHPRNPYEGDYVYEVLAYRISKQTGKPTQIVGGASFHVDSAGVIKGRGVFWVANRTFRLTGGINLSGKGKMKVFYEGGGLHETWQIGEKDLAIPFLSDQQKGQVLFGKRVPDAKVVNPDQLPCPMAGMYAGKLSNNDVAYFLVGDTGIVAGMLRVGNDARNVRGHISLEVTDNKVTGGTFSVSSDSAHIQMTGNYSTKSNVGQFKGTWTRGGTGKGATKGTFTLTKMH